MLAPGSRVRYTFLKQQQLQQQNIETISNRKNSDDFAVGIEDWKKKNIMLYFVLFRPTELKILLAIRIHHYSLNTYIFFCEDGQLSFLR